MNKQIGYTTLIGVHLTMHLVYPNVSHLTILVCICGETPQNHQRGHVHTCMYCMCVWGVREQYAQKTTVPPLNRIGLCKLQAKFSQTTYAIHYNRTLRVYDVQIKKKKFPSHEHKQQ